VFLLSMFFGTARGVVVRQRMHWRLQRRVGRQNLLRAVYELQEQHSRELNLPETVNAAVAFDVLLAKRSWTPRQLRHLMTRAKYDDFLHRFDGIHVQLSEAGFGKAARATRNHRLWETYLITHADVAPQHVDRDADLVEHVLGPELVRKLEEKLKEDGRDLHHVESPHTMEPEGGPA
jgi:manganese/zinc/iron transport system permease protein